MLDVGEGDGWVDEGEGVVVWGDFPESGSDCCDGTWIC